MTVDPDVDAVLVDEFDHFAMVPKWVAFRSKSGLSKTARLLYMIIAEFTNSDGVAWPGRALLASEVGCTQTTLSQALADLEKAGALIVTRSPRSGSQRQKPNVYQIVRTNPANCRTSDKVSSLLQTRGTTPVKDVSPVLQVDQEVDPFEVDKKAASKSDVTSTARPIANAAAAQILNRKPPGTIANPAAVRKAIAASLLDTHADLIAVRLADAIPKQDIVTELVELDQGSKGVSPQDPVASAQTVKLRKADELRQANRREPDFETALSGVASAREALKRANR